MPQTLAKAFLANFLGNAAEWYKLTIVMFLIINPIVMLTFGPFIAGWLLVGEFIFCLAMALKCYPLQPGGLLALEAIVIGLTSPETVFHETEANFEVILLLIFMVAGIFFLKDMLLYIFTKIMVRVKSKVALSLLFSFTAAVLSAFLDALTVTAVIITVAATKENISDSMTLERTRISNLVKTNNNRSLRKKMPATMKISSRMTSKLASVS